MPNPSPSNYPDIGTLGEDLVSQWLESCGWKILHRRWRCRWGEIDIIAEYLGTEGKEGKERATPRENDISASAGNRHLTLAFIEVKTRSAGSWDTGGRDAITTRKQEKLVRAAQMYLAKYPEKSDFNCRFDVAIAFAQKASEYNNTNKNFENIASVSTPHHFLMLQEYIPGAFDSFD
ncbi:YraN family protein [Calothrix sp. UHCC 0171]|uniref:YraN family protein n=1 Tax=Calothrix sp. UHCC 0171 TaxID=3110245 RepID=UPI002B20C629|nr:YraN family protein [Calothrix sp. UHCC 0171]MEA5571408.1 YraN family protein [Calothrix sp. UHCC 0171]